MSDVLSGRRVAVVGAGPGGLTTAKSLLEEGFEPTVFEQSGAVGGQWNAGAGHSGVWPGMRANTSKTLTTFSDLPPDDDLPMFLRAEDVQAYHAAYADRFGVTPRVRLGAAVTSVDRCDGGYEVAWRDAGGTHVERFDGVVVASGRYNRPTLPPIDGLDRFSGRGGVLHSFDYTGRDRHRGQRIVILGNSISGLEIGSDLAADDSIAVYAAFRKPRYIVPRVAMGIPTDWRFLPRINALLMQALPPDDIAAGMKAEILAVAGHPSQYGAPAPHENVFVANIGMAQHWLSDIAEGRIRVRPTVTRVEGNVVTFGDGTRVEADTILCATGYDVHLPFLREPIRRMVQPDRQTLDLYHHTFHPDLSGLVFVGIYVLIGPYAPVLELQGRWIAMTWAGVREPPDEATQRVGMAEWQQAKQVTHEVMMNSLAETFAADAGVTPRLDARPEIAKSLLFGPLAPAQYRLDGHGSQQDAIHRYQKAVASFGGDTSPRPSAEQLAQVALVADRLGARTPELVRVQRVLESLAAGPA